MIKKIKKILATCVFYSKKAYVGRLAICFLYDTGIWDKAKNVFSYLIAKQNNKKPTDSMIESRMFFSKNQYRVNNIVSWLSDDLSKETFLKMIDFRCNSDINNFICVNGGTLKQYFPDNIFHYSHDEVFIDCGAYDGDTIRSFKKYIKKTGGGYKNIIAFEPNKELLNLLNKKYKDVITFNYGVWSEDTVLRFSNERMFTKDENIEIGCISVPVKALDNCEECELSTFIKMDIEGSELQGLIGCEKIIKRMKPKLAICIYHSNEDMLNIAEWIHKTVPEYKIYIRQYRKYFCAETVLYATI